MWMATQPNQASVDQLGLVVGFIHPNWREVVYPPNLSRVSLRKNGSSSSSSRLKLYRLPTAQTGQESTS